MGQDSTGVDSYAGTVYKGQGRTLDRTYLYHSSHWRASTSYVALTRHRVRTELFVAAETARDFGQLARQMALIDDTRAASQFERSEPNPGGLVTLRQLLEARRDRAWRKPQMSREMRREERLRLLDEATRQQGTRRGPKSQHITFARARTRHRPVIWRE